MEAEIEFLKNGGIAKLEKLSVLDEGAIIRVGEKVEYTLSPGTVSKENKKWVDGEYVDVGNSFSTPQEALDYYNKEIKPLFKVDPKKYAEYFNAKRVITESYRSIFDNASIKDKQFIAHRKNYSERLLREEIRSNAIRGMETLSIPTPRTLSLIEGYTSEEGEGPLPYEIDGREEGDNTDLTEGDTIEMHGVSYTVAVSDPYYIEVIETSSTNRINGEEWLNEIHEEDVRTAMDSFDDLIKEKTMFSALEWQNWVSDEDYNISRLDIDEVGELEATDEVGDELYLINRGMAENTIRTNLERGQEEVGDFMREMYPGAWDIGNGVYLVSTKDDYTEALKQPDQYEEVSIEDFDINDMNSSEQTVLRKYEGLVETFRKENPDSSIITDDKGNEWVRMELTTEAENPITVFQVGDNQSAAIQESIENTSSIFDSQLELVDLYSSKEEAQIKKDMDCG